MPQTFYTEGEYYALKVQSDADKKERLKSEVKVEMLKLDTEKLLQLWSILQVNNQADAVANLKMVISDWDRMSLHGYRPITVQPSKE